MLLNLLLASQLPQPLAAHFKTVDTVGELFESMPSAYVRQCIEQIALTPFERAAMLALFETMEIEE